MNSLVAVDIGNSSIKLGWFPAGKTAADLPESHVMTIDVQNLSSPEWDAFCMRVAPDAHWVIASVNQASCEAVSTAITQSSPRASLVQLDNSMLPMQILVDSPTAVGTDRLLAVLAVTALYPTARPAIVIDSGTAVTVDVVDRNGNFAGGVIMPGSNLIARALNTGTAQLPEIQLDKNQPPHPIGTNTTAAISAGIFWGLIGSIKELVRQQRIVLGESTPIFVSGGDGWLAQYLELDCQRVPHLCLKGIAAALQIGLVE